MPWGMEVNFMMNKNWRICFLIIVATIATILVCIFNFQVEIIVSFLLAFLIIIIGVDKIHGLISTLFEKIKKR